MSVDVANDMSIFSLVAGASLPVQLVMIILLLTSYFHGGIFLLKWPPSSALKPMPKTLKKPFGPVAT